MHLINDYLSNTTHEYDTYKYIIDEFDHAKYNPVIKDKTQFRKREITT